MRFSVYGYERNPRTRLVRIIAELEGITLECKEVIPRQNKGKVEYLAKYPLSQGKIPSLEGDNIQLQETVAIVTYLAKLSNKLQLMGDGSLEQECQVLSYLSWANQELLQTMAAWYLPLIPGFADPAPYNEKAIIEGKTRSNNMLNGLELLLQGKTWLVGDHMTVADVMVAIYVSRGFEWVFDAKWRDAHPNIMKLFNAVTETEAVKKVIPNFILIEEETPLKDPYKGKR